MVQKSLCKIKSKQWLLHNFPYFLFWYFGNKLACLYDRIEETEVFLKVIQVVEKIETAFKNPFPSMQWKHFMFGIFCAIALKLAVYIKGKNAKKFH